MRTHPHKLSKLVNSFRHGQTVFYVNSLGNRSFLRKYTIASRPYYEITGSVFIRATYMSKYFGSSHPIVKTHFSLLDSNVLPNRYNTHRLFTSRKAAERYLSMCKTGVVQSMQCSDYSPPPAKYGELV